jgi:hypothetical protein
MFGVPDGAITEKEPSLDEINAKVSREVCLSDDGRSNAWITLILLGGGLLFLAGVSYYLVHKQQQHVALAQEGVDATARVRGISQGRGGSSVMYTFQVDGVIYENDVHWQGGPDRLGIGSQIPVLYLSSDPSVNYPKGWGWFDFGYLFLFYLGGIPVYAGGRSAWNLYRDWRLARCGWVTEGTVTLCVPTKSSGNFMVDYEFRTDRDEVVEGSNNDCPDEYKTDSKIKVIYLRDRPKRNDSYPLSSYCMVEQKSPADLRMANR